MELYGISWTPVFGLEHPICLHLNSSQHPTDDVIAEQKPTFK